MPLSFSPEAQQKIAAIRGRYPNAQAACLPVLHLAQDEFGHLSDEAIDARRRRRSTCRRRTSTASSPSTRCTTATRPGSTCSWCAPTSRACCAAATTSCTRSRRSWAQGRRDLRRRRVHARRGGVPGRLRRRAVHDRRREVLPAPHARDGGRTRSTRSRRCRPTTSAPVDGREPLDARHAREHAEARHRASWASRAPTASTRPSQRGGYGALRQGARDAAGRRSSTRSRSRTCAAAAAPASRPGMKWGFIPKDAKTVYLVINADESEPGTCKDRELLVLGSAPPDRGHASSRRYALGCKHAYIYIRGEMMREHAGRSSAPSTRPTPRATSARSTHAARGAVEARHHRAPRRRRVHLRRGDRAAQLARGQARLAAPQAAVPGGQGPVRRSRRSSTTSRRIDERPGHHRQGRRVVRRPRHGASRAARASSACRATSTSPASSSCRWASRCARSSTTSAAASPAASKVKAVIPGGSRCRRSTPASSTSRCEFDALMTDERIKPVEVKPGVTVRPGRRQHAAHHGRLGRRRRDGRQHRHRRAVRAHHAVLRARVVRPVHAVPRGHRLAGARLPRALAERRRASRATSSCCASIAHGIAGNTICALGDAAAWPMLGFLTKFRADFEAKHRKTGARPPAGAAALVQTAAPATGTASREAARERSRSQPCAPPAGHRRLPPPTLAIGASCSGVHRRARGAVGAIFTITRAQPDRRGHVAGRHLLRPGRDLRDAVGALPRRAPGAGLRRRHHGAVRLRRHDPEPRRGRAGGAWRGVLAARSSAASRSSTCVMRKRRLPPRRGRRRRTAEAPPADVRHRRAGRRHPVHRLPVPVRGDLDPAARRGRRRASSVALAPERGRRDARRRPQQHELASDYPATTATARRASLDDPHRTDFLVLAAVLFLIGVARRAPAPQRAHRADERSSCSSTPPT